MRINNYFNPNTIQQQNNALSEGVIKKKEETTVNDVSSQNAFQIKDTYESSTNQMKTDFGGYDRNGRGGLAKLSATSSVDGTVRKLDDFSTDKPSGSILDGLSSVLGTDSETAYRKLSDSGLSVEELVEPEKVSALSDNPATQNALVDFSTGERASLLAESGMTDDELTDFVARVKE